MAIVFKVALKVPVIVRLEGTNVDLGKRILKVTAIYTRNLTYIFILSAYKYFQFDNDNQLVQQESGMTLITADDLDDAAQKAVKAAY